MTFNSSALVRKGRSMFALYRSEQGHQKILAHYDTLIRRFPVPVTTHMIATRYGETHVMEWGDPKGPPLILLHGHATNSGMWQPYAGMMPQYRSIAIDILGQPGKTTSYVPRTDSSEYMQWLDDVWQTLGVKQATFLGMSFGGYLAIRYAICHPERVHALITLAPAGISHVQIPRVVWSVLPAMIGEAGGLEATRRLGSGTSEPEMERMLTLSLGHYVGLPVLRPWLHSDEELRNLKMPVLLLNGDDDAFFDGRASVSRLRRLLPHCQAEVIPGETHMLNKHFDVIMQKISAFCSETTPRALL